MYIYEGYFKSIAQIYCILAKHRFIKPENRTPREILTVLLETCPLDICRFAY